MPSKAVYDAVKARLDANWTTPPVTYPDTGGEPPSDGAEFIRVEYPLAAEELASIGSPGSNINREMGAIRFIINTQKGQGITDGLVWADQLRALFRNKEFDGVLTFEAPPPTFGGENDMGMYEQMSFAVEYQYDYLA